MGLLTAALVDAATFERDLRLNRAAQALRLASVGEDGPAQRERIIISCQSWSAIVTWLEDDRFESFLGGEEVEGRDNPVVSWPELEAAALRALTSAKDDTEANRIQKARLAAIHARLARMRRDVDFINEHFRQSREGIAA